jgi:hypothetical protein
VVSKRKPRAVRTWNVARKADAIREVRRAVAHYKTEGGVEGQDPRRPYEATWSWTRGKLLETVF